MKSVNMHEAKTNLSRLVAEAAKGEAFVIAKAGKPLVKVVPLDAPAPRKMRRLGFMAGRIKVPDECTNVLRWHQAISSRPSAAA